MSLKRAVIAFALLCSGVPAMAQPEGSDAANERACLTQRRLYSYQPVPGNRSLVAEDTARQRYRVNFYGVCHNLQFQFGLAFRTRSVGTLSCIERGDSVLLSDPVGPNQCLIRSVVAQTRDMDRLDAEEAAARRTRR